MRWNVLEISRSMPGVTRSRNSTTVTSAPKRPQTEPNSSPITPAPTTRSFFGTEESDSATGGEDDVLAGQRTGLAVGQLHFALAGRRDAGLADNGFTFGLLEQEL